MIREYIYFVDDNPNGTSGMTDEEIVRCKECRFGQWHEQAEEYICIAHDQDLFNADHFCSYGEREGE